MIVADLPLFASAPVTPMVRSDDRSTCSDAADRVLPKIRELHAQVLAAVRTAATDGITDRELERLPQFARYGPSTVRKRRSELYQLGYLAPAGVRDRLTVWVVSGMQEAGA